MSICTVKLRGLQLDPVVAFLIDRRGVEMPLEIRHCEQSECNKALTLKICCICAVNSQSLIVKPGLTHAAVCAMLIFNMRHLRYAYSRRRTSDFLPIEVASQCMCGSRRRRGKLIWHERRKSIQGKNILASCLHNCTTSNVLSEDDVGIISARLSSLIGDLRMHAFNSSPNPFQTPRRFPFAKRHNLQGPVLTL